MSNKMFYFPINYNLCWKKFLFSLTASCRKQETFQRQVVVLRRAYCLFPDFHSRGRKFRTAERNLITVVSGGLSASKMFPLSSLYDRRADCAVPLDRRATVCGGVENLVRSIGGEARATSNYRNSLIEYLFLRRLTAKWRNSENGL